MLGKEDEMGGRPKAVGGPCPPDRGERSEREGEIEPDLLNPTAETVRGLLWGLPRMAPVEGTSGLYVLYRGSSLLEDEEVILGASKNVYGVIRQYVAQGTKFKEWGYIPVQAGSIAKVLRRYRAALAE